MADGDTGNDKPSLELPRLGLRRRRKKAPPTPVAAPADDTVVEETAVDETAVLPPAPPPPPPPAPELEEPAPVAVEEPREPTRRAPRVRRPGGMPAAVLTGVVVGLGMVGLTWAGLKLCETVQGTSSCGGSGYPLLAAILVLMVVVGGLLLRAARVPDPGSTSFLAVGVTAVLALLFLVDSLLDTAMIVVIPLISAASYALAHWFTRTFIEPAEH